MDSDGLGEDAKKTSLTLFPEGNEKAFMSRIGDILNFARMRLIKISELAFSPDTSIREALSEYPVDALRMWERWEKAKGVAERKHSSPLISFETVGHYSNWIKSGLVSDHDFEIMYMELCELIVGVNKFLQRNRFLSRILAELAEIYIARGDLDNAVQNLLTCINNCALDPWDSLLSWRVFRLACCQRKLGNAPEYLKTLTYCLGSRLAKAAPVKLLAYLQNDLEAIVRANEVADLRWNILPLFGMKIDIQKTIAGSSVQPLITSSVLMHICEIGDEVITDVMLQSNLSETVEINSVKIFLMKIDDYQRHSEAKDEVEESDAAFVFTSGSPVVIKPGDNSFTFPWMAMAVGQYVISSVCVEWHNASFYKDFSSSPEEAIGFHVLPNEPTQSIELNPIFLIPGHVQDVRLHFYSGSDYVNGGKIKLVCSQGLQVMSREDGAKKNDQDSWCDSCEFDLDLCLPNSTTTIVASVKSEAIDSYNPRGSDQYEEEYSYSSLQSLEATVTTSYHHGAYKAYIDSGKPIESPPITAILEASVTTLELAALTIKNSGAYLIGDGYFMISATVLCNTPVPFSLKEWEIVLPSILRLDENGELNEGLFDSSVLEGEELFFGFRCKLSGNLSNSEEDKPTILSVVLEDSFGKSFRQVLPLDISGIDNELKSIKGEAKDFTAANAELKANSLEGLVGAPVIFTYKIDFKPSEVDAFPSQILYHLSCIDEDWIVGGSVRGILNYRHGESSSLTFVGIPVKAGIIKRFPRIELAALRESESPTSMSSNITVLQQHPSVFLSLAHTSINEMTCASQLIEI